MKVGDKVQWRGGPAVILEVFEDGTVLVGPDDARLKALIERFPFLPRGERVPAHYLTTP